MTTSVQTWTEERVELLTGGVHVLKAGKGDPVVILHRDVGYPDRQPFLDDLARQFTVYLPSHPGFARSEPKNWTWPLNVRDLAIVELQLFRKLGLDSFSVVGLGFGGWLAAEMATMNDRVFKKMVLVAPFGLQPRKGELFDQFLANTESYVRTMFHDVRNFEASYTPEPQFEQLDAWEYNREMTCRVAWKPNMFNQTLGKMLPGVRTPTLLVWGRQDRVAPLECGELYVQALPSARLQILDACGHAVDLEKPAELARLVTEFLRGR